ncbi:barstar family protein [Micromonospora sp. NPDC047548]|uniref:barstar family protein n=1 Tax=Micromonospora sp. NPDC047548 TaxID=3155624 RepID=UPI0034119B70
MEDAVPPSGEVAVARLDGAAMANVDGVFEQFSDALRFPSYFGWNWPALSECLRDLHWLSARRYLIIIENAPCVLRENADRRGVLFSILTEVGRHWANSYEAEDCGKGPLFHAILLCDERDAESLKQEVAAASRP